MKIRLKNEIYGLESQKHALKKNNADAMWEKLYLNSYLVWCLVVACNEVNG